MKERERKGEKKKKREREIERGREREEEEEATEVGESLLQLSQPLRVLIHLFAPHLQLKKLYATTDHSENPEIESCTKRYSSQFKNNCLTEMRSGSEEVSYSRRIDGCITQL